MAEEAKPPPAVVTPAVVYCMFAGSIDQGAVQRFHNAIAIASANKVQQIHLLFQCGGGIVGDGISLYNLFRACPIDLTIYNAGSVCSMGTVAFLGAKHRKASENSAFMFHRAYVNPVGANASRLSTFAGQMEMDDQRIERILKAHTKIPSEKWAVQEHSDVWLSASEAVAAGMADEIREFSPPPGTQLFNIWPPQS